MKTSIHLLVSVTAIFFAQAADAQNVLFRHATAPYEKYRAALMESSFRSSPADELEKRLQADELPPRLQEDLDATLARAAAEPSNSAALFQALYKRLEQEPRSAAVRETMSSILERVIPLANSEARGSLENQLAVFKKMQDPGRDLRLQNSLVQKEIQGLLRKLQSQPGGEDVVLFWNGMRWNERLPVDAGTRSQWILLSSRWKPRLFSGGWSEVSGKIDSGFQDWVSGTCADPIYTDAAFVADSRREALFDRDCIAEKTNFLPTTRSPIETSSRSWISPEWKPVLWTGAIAAGALILLSASGKKLQLRR